MNRMGVWALAVSLTTMGCGMEGSGRIETIEQDIGDVSAVEVHDGIEARIERGARPRLRLRGDDNLLELLVVKDDRGVLSVALPQSVGGVRPSEPIRLELELPRLSALSATDGSVVEVEGLGEDVDIELEDGSEARFERLWGGWTKATLSDGGVLRVGKLEGSAELHLSDGSVVRVDGGQLASMDVEASDGSRLAAPRLRVEALDVRLSDSSSVLVGEVEALFGHLENTSSLEYRGRASAQGLELEDGSSVRRLD